MLARIDCVLSLHRQNTCILGGVRKNIGRLPTTEKKRSGIEVRGSQSEEGSCEVRAGKEQAAHDREEGSREEMKMAKEKKISPAKQMIIENYEQRKQQYLEAGYQEQIEVISVLKANIMAFVTAGPFVVIGFFLWIWFQKQNAVLFDITGSILFLILIFVCMFIHEVLHGIGWLPWTKNGWQSIYLGIMWEYATPYCHCKEPLKPRQYLVGGLLPFLVLGVGMYLLAFATGSHFLWILSLLNMLSAGGDTTIVCMLFKYLKQNETCYILDHPTDCGFVAFIKEEK